MKRDPNKLLIDNKLKQTRPRLLVLEQIIGRSAAVSQPELEKTLKQEVDRVTLYRTLTTFEEKGILHKIMGSDGKANYAMCDTKCTIDHHQDQHLHFSCSTCQKIYCLDIQIPNIAIPNHFNVDAMQVMATGTCETCSKKPK
ncbi:Fur family transcriptional regulator [Pedobacter lithocola]|uniref:Fur family transcriptional regulator n=1 Tax=Pedobacter lithocola TaxID=1908239 RepID=A0ABV8PGB8_9SPHI